MRWRSGLLGLIAVCVAPGVARADEDPSEEIPPGAPPGPPEGLGQKQRLRDDDLARKREGGYFTGLPLANYDHDIGFGFGARVYYFDDGKRSDPFFPYTPY